MVPRHGRVSVAAFATALGIVASVAAPHGRQPPGPAKHFVWRVSRADKPVAWLVGSVHVLKRDAYPLPEIFDRVFAATGTVIEEVDLGAAKDPAAVMPIAARAILTDGTSLRDLLDRDTYALVSAKAEAAGLPMLLLDRMKPWLVAMTLVVPELKRSGFDPAFGLDQHYFDKAEASKRTVRGLETAAYQVERLDGLAMTTQIEMLRAVLSDVDTQIAAVDQVVAAWRTGDVETLERLLLQEFKAAPEIYRRLLVERNQTWTPQIAACEAEAAPCLVVVGGAHLVGPDSVVALLRRAGFTVEQQ